MKICCFSDTHTKEAWLNVPECDILIFAGDFHITSIRELEIANRYFSKLHATHKLFIAGNHDTILEFLSQEEIEKLFPSVIYLKDRLVIINGLRFYGSPYSPEFNNWSFMYQRNSLEAKKIWEKIPENLDFLITHCPPYGVMDRNMNDERCGCSTLLREIDKKQPRRNIFGHIHLFGGQSTTQEGIDFYNVSVLNEEYKLTNKPTVIEL